MTFGGSGVPGTSVPALIAWFLSRIIYYIDKADTPELIIDLHLRPVLNPGCFPKSAWMIVEVKSPPQALAKITE